MFLVRLGNESGCNGIRALWGVFGCAGCAMGRGMALEREYTNGWVVRMYAELINWTYVVGLGNNVGNGEIR